MVFVSINETVVSASMVLSGRERLYSSGISTHIQRLVQASRFIPLIHFSTMLKIIKRILSSEKLQKLFEQKRFILLSDQINLLKINEIVDKRGVVLGLRTTFLMAKKWF